MSAPPLDLADTDTPRTTAWLAGLANYEDAIDGARRMALYATAARTVDRATGEVSHSPDLAAAAALADCLGDIAAWVTAAQEAATMIAILDGALSWMEAEVPIADFAAWQRACGLYLRLRYAVGSVRPLPPAAPWRAWQWGISLASWRTNAYRDHMIVVRQRYGLLTPAAREAVRAEYGIGGVADILHKVFPVEALHTLDYRAGLLHVDTRVRLDMEDRWLLAAQAKTKRRRRAGAAGGEGDGDGLHDS